MDERHTRPSGVGARFIAPKKLHMRLEAHKTLRCRGEIYRAQEATDEPGGAQGPPV